MATLRHNAGGGSVLAEGHGAREGAMKTIILVASALTALSGAPAAGSPLKSLYTTIELGSCRTVQRHADGNAWECSGLEGWPVWIAEGDLRTFVSVGPEPAKRRAATQTLPAFNSPFAEKSTRATLEWRFDRRGGRIIPYATILRYVTRSDRAHGAALIVTRVTRSDTCQVAWIDALANPDAIAIARRIADTVARTFDCSQNPTVAGARGHSPM